MWRPAGAASVRTLAPSASYNPNLSVGVGLNPNPGGDGAGGPRWRPPGANVGHSGFFGSYSSIQAREREAAEAGGTSSRGGAGAGTAEGTGFGAAPGETGALGSTGRRLAAWQSLSGGPGGPVPYRTSSPGFGAVSYRDQRAAAAAGAAASAVSAAAAAATAAHKAQVSGQRAPPEKGGWCMCALRVGWSQNWMEMAGWRRAGPPAWAVLLGGRNPLPPRPVVKSSPSSSSAPVRLTAILESFL